MNLNSKIKYISFDLFDTLIKRDVKKPTDVFKLVEILLENEKSTIKDFKKVRREAEVDLYPKKKLEEITLEEIYENFPEHIDRELRQKYMKSEEEMEIQISTFNENMRAVYEEAIHSDKEILITTDIYLSKKVITEILNKNNIRYDCLYVSSEVRLKKKTGNLYTYIKKELKCSGRDILHIGDNRKSDFLRATQQGIHSKKIPTTYYNCQYNDIKQDHTLNYSFLAAFINNRCFKIENYYEQLGYETLGPLLYGFSTWLHGHILSNEIEKIFFLSRDGKIMKRAYEILYEDKNCAYLYASRRALIIPNLCKCNNEKEMLANFSLPKQIKTSALIKKLGLAINDEILSLLSKRNLNLNTYMKEEELLKDDSQINLFLKDILNLVKENSKIEQQAEELYLEKRFLDTQSKNIAIVDIGWYGNMQNNLEEAIVPYHTNVHGYYMGLVPKYSNGKAKKMEGYLFDTKDSNFNDYIREKNYNSLFELLFSADHGTVIKYLDFDQVELAEFEYSLEQKEKILSIQKGALEFVKDFKNSILSKIIQASPQDYSYNIHQLGNKPHWKDTKNIGNFMFYDNEISTISNYKSMFYYMFHLKTMYIDFTRSQWKIGFLKRLFKIPLPYEKICKKLRGERIR